MNRFTERRLKVEAQLAELEGRALRARARAGERERTLETRRRFLVGAAVLTLVERGVLSEADLRELVDEFLTRPGDRALFGLPPVPGPDDAEG